jgi:nitroimidazol reductase NimA-like FMN-containing flavoprotein (pyridoxamine 5'-phosphate oxidase superfamily)
MKFDDHSSVLDRLTRDECLQFMASVPVGRIVYTRRAMPAVELVNFTMDNGDVVVRTDASGKLAAATHAAVVAFEADALDLDQCRGWSVTVVGYSREVTDPRDVARLRESGPHPWASGEREHFIRITPGIVNGRRLG